MGSVQPNSVSTSGWRPAGAAGGSGQRTRAGPPLVREAGVASSQGVEPARRVEEADQRRGVALGPGRRGGGEEGGAAGGDRKKAHAPSVTAGGRRGHGRPEEPPSFRRRAVRGLPGRASETSRH